MKCKNGEEIQQESNKNQMFDISNFFEYTLVAGCISDMTWDGGALDLIGEEVNA